MRELGEKNVLRSLSRPSHDLELLDTRDDFVPNQVIADNPQGQGFLGCVLIMTLFGVQSSAGKSAV